MTAFSPLAVSKVLPGRVPLFGASPDVLAGIYQPEVNLAVWQRSLPAAVSAEVGELLASPTPALSLRRVVSVADFCGDPARHLPIQLSRGVLADDIALLADMFACLFDLGQIGVRLMTLEHAMCPRFHVDRVPCRLLTSYGGPGTQWLLEEALTKPWRDLNELAAVDDPVAITELDAATASLNTADVGLFKGETWPENSDNGIVHRSPPIDQGSRRLVLTLDMI